MDKFESSIAQILEVDEVSLNDELESFDAWDSMTILSIIAFCYDEYNTSLDANEIKSVKTILGLKKLIEGKKLV
ncbi:acyl carrier protein [Sediminicola arcticus]|jgi:acyl carrier protein|uniref:Acyl carrier protein n=1 Tax=Sediminicola arcticus TaxID=1574308 RepID=A0ABV2SUD7_9FLAO